MIDRLSRALADRYRLDREIGAGGMATVYLAQDLRHDRQVAVKVLRPELAATLGPDRFLREIKIAAQLQHPHILPLLDSGEAEGFLFYVMPYIEGESLRDRLTRTGELPVIDAVRLLRDVADALSYAHGRGVVHRDIKPDNVLLSGRHAMVTDFGVAKAVSEATGRQSLTTAGVALGTPAYMAPEQAAADPHVDHRADVYALGAMGYELLTGRPPFVGLTPQQVLAAHVTENPKPVSEHRPACPPLLAELIMRCLAKRPADRWQTAEQMVERFEALGTPSGGITPTQTQPTAAVAAVDAWYGHPVRVAGLYLLVSIAVMGSVYFLTIQLGLPDWVPWGALALLAAGLPIMVVTGLVERRRRRQEAHPSLETGVRRHLTWQKARRGGYLAFGVLALVTLAYAVMRMLGIGPAGTLLAAGQLQDRDQLIIADFENRTADSSLAGSVTEAFRIDLGQSPVVRILPTSVVSAALDRMHRSSEGRLPLALAREVATREGAKAVVAGEISTVGRSYVLVARIVGAEDGAELVAIRETAADDASIVEAIDRLSGRLRERIGESLRTIRAGAPLEKVTTSSLEALRLYTEANRLNDRGEMSRAIPLLQQALALDSGFAMAWRKLAVAYGNSFASQDAVVDATARAYRFRDRLPELERELTTAYYYNTVDVRGDSIEAAYRRILRIDPSNAIALNNLAFQLNLLGRFAEAESLARAGLRLDADISNIHMQVAFAQTGQGKLDEARQTLALMAERNPSSPLYLWGRAMLLSLPGPSDSARRAWLELGLKLRDPSYQTMSNWGLIALARTEGKLAEAARLALVNEQLSVRRGLPGEALRSFAERARSKAAYEGDSAGAVQILEEGLRRYPLAGMPPLDRPYGSLVTAWVMAGRLTDAKRLLSEYEASVPAGFRRGSPDWYRARGWIDLTEARPREALREFAAIRTNGQRSEWGLWETGLTYERLGQPDSAIVAYEQAVIPFGTGFGLAEDPWAFAPSLKRLGELYESRGDREKAIQNYSRFIELWRDADPVLQPAVREVKARLARLSSEAPAQ